jgi:hypothetical protein
VRSTLYDEDHGDFVVDEDFRGVADDDGGGSVRLGSPERKEVVTLGGPAGVAGCVIKAGGEGDGCGGACVALPPRRRAKGVPSVLCAGIIVRSSTPSSPSPHNKASKTCTTTTRKRHDARGGHGDVRSLPPAAAADAYLSQSSPGPGGVEGEELARRLRREAAESSSLLPPTYMSAAPFCISSSEGSTTSARIVTRSGCPPTPPPPPTASPRRRKRRSKSRSTRQCRLWHPLIASDDSRRTCE